MERFTISLDDALAAQFDELIAALGYGNRSEAFRDMIRAAIEANRQRQDVGGLCIANFSYVYNRHVRDLSERLTSLQHDHHDVIITTTHVHLDHAHCMESIILKGPDAVVQRFADAVAAARGVHHGKLNLVSLETGDRHLHGYQSVPHVHSRPAT